MQFDDFRSDVLSLERQGAVGTLWLDRPGVSVGDLGNRRLLLAGDRGCAGGIVWAGGST